jgi:hypothetical protein
MPVFSSPHAPGAGFAKKPCDPFVAICCEGHWFWIEKRDFRSRRTMGYLLVLPALTDTGAKESLPVITIQAI